jgi:hypothetical protein
LPREDPSVVARAAAEVKHDVAGSYVEQTESDALVLLQLRTRLVEVVDEHFRMLDIVDTGEVMA